MTADERFDQIVRTVFQPRSLNWRRIAWRFGIRIRGDRLGTVSMGPWWCHLVYGTTAAGGLSLYIARRRILFRPIDYSKAPK